MEPVTFGGGGKEINILSGGGGLSGQIVRNLAREIRHTYDGRNHLEVRF